MPLDKLLKENAAWLEQALRRRVFEKVDQQTIRIAEDQRARRMAEIKTRIDDLSRRKQAAAASYDQAIAAERAELEQLEKHPRDPSIVPKFETRPAGDRPAAGKFLESRSRKTKRT